MPKITALTVAVTAILLIALTGCASSAGDAVDERTDLTATDSAAPLVADKTPETESPATPDAIFLERVRAELPDDTVIPDATDAQLIAAAAEACEQMNSGIDVAAVDVIEGEAPNDLGIRESSAKIAASAKDTYCPQGY